MIFNVFGDMKAIARDLDVVERKIQRQAAASAMNRTAATVRTASVREIAASKQITPQKLVRDRLIFKRPQRATARRLLAYIIALIAPIQVIKLTGARQTRTGAAARGRRIPGGFIARMPSGHRGVFKRKGKPRLPIAEQTVPLQPEAETIINKHIGTTGAAAWIKNFNREMSRRLKSKRA